MISNNTIYIDLTSLYYERFLSGIQRTVFELVERILKKHTKCMLLLFSREKNDFFILSKNDFFKMRKNKSNIKINNLKKINIKKVKNCDIWLDVDSAWDTVCLERHKLYPFLSKKKVKIISFLYDLLPLTFPKYFDKNISRSLFLYVTSMFYYSNLIVVNSKYVKEQVANILEQIGIKKEIEIVPLGSNFTCRRNVCMKVNKNVKKLANEKYLLMVGTIEPRKNHTFLINSYNECLSKRFKKIKLVFAGRIGWSNKDILRKMRTNKNFILINEPNDREIEFLYKHAFALIFPSVSEGFGLPIVESLHYKCPVFATNIGLFDEISKGNAILFDINTTKDFNDKISFYLNNNKAYKDLKKRISSYKPLSWDESYEILKKNINKF